MSTQVECPDCHHQVETIGGKGSLTIGLHNVEGTSLSATPCPEDQPPDSWPKYPDSGIIIPKCAGSYSPVSAN